MSTRHCDRGHSWIFSGETACPTCGSSSVQDGPSLDQTIPGDATGDFTPAPPADGTLAWDSSPSKLPPAPTERTLAHDPSNPVPSDSTVEIQVLSADPSDRTLIHVNPRTEGPAHGTVDFELGPPPPGTPVKDSAEATLDQTSPDQGVKKNEPAGRTIPGYEILRQLGKGGMGVVYQARQAKLNRLVALKMILGGGLAGADQIARFKFEAESIAALQHPNIVQVYEVGEVEGCPFFSLEYIDGKTLDDQVEGPQPPREAARMVQVLAQAMHAAHGRGIIHRDLKPANILLTQDGTPKITDFGLAKRFDQPDEGKTHSGAILGTPSYMAPEQALGKTREAGPAADIYSLGAILYDLVTGRPPFQGTTVLQTLQQVQKNEPVSPARLQPGLPRDLETICLKTLEKDPVKRYATAGELADELGRYLAGEPILARPTPIWERAWKWARRRPAAAALVGLGFFSTLLILVLGGLYLDSQRRTALALAEQEKIAARAAQEKEQLAREQAEREQGLRKSAEKNFQRAKQAVDHMLTQVGQKQLAHIPQMEKVRRDLLGKALEFYKDFREEKSDDPQIRWESARAHQRVADILELLGDHPQAEKAYQEALTLLLKLMNDQPGHLDYRRDFANVSGNLGNLLKDVKRTQEAESIYRQALKVRGELLTADPKNPDLRLDLARSHLNLGVVLFLIGKTQEAEPSYHTARSLLESLHQDQPDQERFAVELARCLNNLSTLQKNLGQTTEAGTSLRQARTILLGLVQKHPQEPGFQQELGLACRNLGELYRDTQPAEAEKMLRQALQFRQDLAKKFSATPIYRQEWAQAHADLAVLYQAQGQLEEADREYDQALKIQGQMAADFPHLPDLRLRLAASWNNRGNMLATQNRWKEAEQAFLESRDLLEKLAKEFPKVPDYQAELVGTQLNLGTTYQATGRPQDAESAYRLALKTRRDLARNNPQVLLHQKELGNVLLNLATLLQIQQKFDEAEKLYREAGDLFARLAAEQPGEPDYRHQWALALNNLGSLLRQTNQAEETERMLAKAVEVLSGLIRDFPRVSSYQLDLARSLNEYAITLTGLGKLAQAEKSWQEALIHLQALTKANPNRVEALTLLGQLHGNLAILLIQRNRADLALDQFRAAVAVLDGLWSKGSASADAARLLVQHQQHLARLLEASNMAVEAEKNWGRLLELQETLVQQNPQSADLRLEAASTLQELAGRLLQQEQFDKAKPLLKSALGHLGKLRPPPAHLNICRGQLAEAHLGLKEVDSALKLIEEGTAGKDVSFFPQFAVLLARCSKLDAKNADRHAEQAVALLQKAVAAGFKEEPFLRNNVELSVLREREDFQAMLKSLKK